MDDANDLTPVYEDAGRRYGIDPDFLRAQDDVESRSKDLAISPAGAEGRAQFMPATARQMGVHDPFDPREAIPAQARLIRENYDRSGSMAQAVAEYHGGTDPRNWGDRTHAYVNDVTSAYEKRKAQQAPAFDASKPFETEGQKPPAFDPNKPFQTEGQEAPKFDPSKPFQAESDVRGWRQMPMAQTDQPSSGEHPQSPAGTQPSAGELEDQKAVEHQPGYFERDLQARHEQAQAIWGAIKEGWQATPEALTPLAIDAATKFGASIGMPGLGSVVQTGGEIGRGVVAAFNAAWAGAGETANQLGVSMGMPGLGNAMQSYIETAGMHGGPELPIAEGAHAMEQGRAMMGRGEAAPEPPPGSPGPPAPVGNTSQPSPTPTLDAVAGEARARAAQTPEATATETLRQEATPAQPAAPGSAVDALEKKAVSETEPQQSNSPIDQRIGELPEPTQPPAPPPHEAAPEPAEPPPEAPAPDVRQRLAEVSAQEAERSKAEEASPPPEAAETRQEPEPPPGDHATLYSFPGAVFDPDAWKRTFGPLAPPLRELSQKTADYAQSAANAFSPMGMGTTRAQAHVAQFANDLRTVQYRFAQIDKEITGTYKSPQEREALWSAMEAQSVFEQQVRDLSVDQQAAAREAFDRGGTGVAGLNERQRQTIDSLDAISQDAWRQMQQRGMVAPDARPIPYYMPRQILTWSAENGFERPKGSGAASASVGIDARGANLTTNGPMRREHLTPEETEAAAQAKLGENAQILRDIRSLPSRLAYTYRAIAGVDLMNKIEETGKLTGVNLVLHGDLPGSVKPGDYFTMSDHPAFRRWTGSGWQAIHVADEYRGPLKAVLTKPAGDLYHAAMALKGGLMKTIMWSPFQHLNVEIGRALPMMRSEIVSVFKDGHRVRQDLGYMDQATRDGIAPLGQRSGWENDPISIADATREPAQHGPLYHAAAAVPRAFDQLHQKILWDRVFDLQMGIYDHLKQKWTADGFPERVAGIMAAHEANRYAGALPPENLARGANMAANLLLFSRSFTLGNLGVIKDMFNGAPSHTRALIEHEFSPAMMKQAQSAMRRKAIAAFTMDIGLQYLGTALAQTAWRAGQLAAIAGGVSYISQGTQQALGEWYDKAKDAIAASRVNPLEAFGIFPQHWNEPGKEDRAYLGTDPQSQRGVYARLMTGKIGEEFMGWFSRPGDLLLNKLNVGVRAGVEDVLGQDAYGKLISKPYPRTIWDYIDKAGAYVQHIGGSMGPTATIEGIAELGRLYTGGGKDSPATAWAKVLVPATGLGQISEGYPGGPAAGEIHAQTERQRFAVQQAMPSIREKIKAGDTAGAVEDMTKLGIEPGLQRYYLRQTVNPQPSRRQFQNFQRTAPAEVLERMARDRAGP